MRASYILPIILAVASTTVCLAQSATNPVIFADVPDMSIVRVGHTYYMSSTTMHMSPGVPIMKSIDLVNWSIVNYAYDTLASVDELNLVNGKSTYGRGSWASCIRFHKGMYYVSTFAQTTGKTYIYTTKDIERGPWKVISFSPSYHDHTIFFDDDGRTYLIYGAGKLSMIELNADASGIRPGSKERVILENASAPAGDNIALKAEGSQLFKVNGKYYIFNIVWPKDGMRTVLVHRSERIDGPYEGRVALQDRGIAQGGLIDTPEGKWFAYLFRDYGSVGRIPYLVPVTWSDGWPVLGENGKVPETLDLRSGTGLIPGIVASDEFDRKRGDRPLPLVWQWNHNPDNSLWSLKKRKGFLRLQTGRVDTAFLFARNTLTQRTIGPTSAAATLIDLSAMKVGDFAGLTLLQKRYGQVGIEMNASGKQVVMINAESGRKEIQRIPISVNSIFLKAECDFRELKDVAMFYYSLDGSKWFRIGNELHMKYTLPHFMGYRFGIYYYATKEVGGHVDVDYFRIQE